MSTPSATLTNLPAGPVRPDLLNSKIFIVDDEAVNIKVVEKFLRKDGYSRFVTTTNASQALDIMRSEMPDVVLLDVIMPGINGLEILKQIRSDSQLKYLPVLILTAASDRETKQKALHLGATDFLPKPVDPDDLHPRVRNALIAKAHQDALKDYAGHLEKEVRLRTAELEASRQDIIFCLAGAGEYRDQETGNHVIRVGLFAGIVARELGLDEEAASLLEQAALLHDIGKIGVSDLILLKPGELSDEEFAMMKKHCEIGKNIIEPSADMRWRNVGNHDLTDQSIPIGKSPIMALASQIAMSHHERWDGCGYPLGLKGEDIPIEGRIVAVVDVFDALSSNRPYKAAMPFEEALNILDEGRGTHFDPAVYDAFIRVKDKIAAVQQEYIDVFEPVDERENIDQIMQIDHAANEQTAKKTHMQVAKPTPTTPPVSVSELRRAFSGRRRTT